MIYIYLTHKISICKSKFIIYEEPYSYGSFWGVFKDKPIFSQRYLVGCIFIHSLQCTVPTIFMLTNVSPSSRALFIPLAPIHTNRIRTLMTGRAQHCTGQLMHLLQTMYSCIVRILDLQCRLLKNTGWGYLKVKKKKYIVCFFFRPSTAGTLKLFISNPNANQSLKPSQQIVHNYKQITLYHLIPPTNFAILRAIQAPEKIVRLWWLPCATRIWPGQKIPGSSHYTDQLTHTLETRPFLG